MTLGLLAVLPILSLAGAVVSGLLGVGGAIVMIPLLLYGPPLLGVGQLDIRTVAAITMVQVFVAAVSGMLAHRRHRAVNARLAFVGGVTMSAGSLAGALGSRYVSDAMLLFVFAAMVTVAAGFMFVPTPPVDVLTPGQERPFSRSLTALVALVVGVGAGLVGAGGAFLLVPLLLVVVGMPIRVTIGSSLAITAMAAAAGVVGKFVTGQIPLLLALVVALGALPGASLGAALSRRMSGPALKLLLFVIILITGVRVWWDVLFH
ncbi:MAG TPA: sulfite exporter TauE/SafE family protein [Candidatus Limnocylindria bacterium]|nr:sulfite exporter TauE/SafE family protein [Candidatus Limnocylindria bacterium]